MKHLFYIIAVLFLLGACTYRHAPHKVSENIVLNGGEEDEYELLIIDPGFESWFAANARPVGFYSLSYYEAQNWRFVNFWNEQYHRTGGRGPFENPINYDPSESYGLELNYRLYWYFKYVRSRYGGPYGFPI